MRFNGCPLKQPQTAKISVEAKEDCERVSGLARLLCTGLRGHSQKVYEIRLTAKIDKDKTQFDNCVSDSENNVGIYWSRWSKLTRSVEAWCVWQVDG